MGRELYERVSVGKLKAGDMVLSSDLEAIVEWNETVAEMAKAYPHHYRYPKLRRIDPADDPRVLRRAIELLMTSGGDRLPYDSERQIIEQYIDQARRELESEGRGGE